MTDFHELNQPPNTTVAEDNCDLDRKGSRRRRLGIDFEADYQVSDTTFSVASVTSDYLGTQTWEAVNNNGNRNFLVVQIGLTLKFYDLAVSPVSAGELPFSINLHLHRADSTTTDAQIASTEASVTSGKGAIFVSGQHLHPFYVTYDQTTNTITSTPIDIFIRDFKQQSAGTNYEDQPTSIDYLTRYDYLNQGWYVSNIYMGVAGNDILIHGPLLDWYYVNFGAYSPTGADSYPPMSMAWWLGKADPDGDKHNHVRFDISWYKTAGPVGNLRAPLGHYIINPFNINRTGVSGVEGFPIEHSSDRPTAIAFYAGKVFYGWKNQIFFSQTIIDDLGVAGRCYQSADPTAADINNLIATDGGVIPLQYSGEILKMYPYENSLLVFCTNGVWALGGETIGQGFSADGYSLYKISSVGAVSSRSIVDVDGTPTWWSKIGIYMIESGAAKQGFSVVNLLKDKIQLFYDAIPGTSKLYASGAYDRLRKLITWVYNSGTEPIDGNPYFCNRILNYDTLLRSFFPYTLSDLPTNTPRVADVFQILDVTTETVEEDVVDNAGSVVVNTLGAAVTVEDQIIGNFDNQSNIGVKYLTLVKETISG